MNVVSSLLVIALLLLPGLCATPALAQPAPVCLDQAELQSLRSEEKQSLRDMRGGAQKLEALGLTERERSILDQHQTQIRGILAAYRGGDMETGLSVTWWILIGLGIAAGVALLIVLILLFTI